MIYKAHVCETTGEVQTIKEHSENTAELCRSFAMPDLREILYTIGLTHDVGKFQHTFQRRIDGDNVKIEHSICGAREVQKLHKNALGLLMAYCIAGHHSGLPDGGSKGDSEEMPTLWGRLKRTTEDYDEYKQELCLPSLDDAKSINYLISGCEMQLDSIIDQFAFWTRYAYSCLVDADSLDTAEFCRVNMPRHLHADFQKALSLVSAKLDSFYCVTALQKSRAVIQEQVFQKKEQQADIYLMNMPTGSGKTLCSVRFALERALREEKKRIIYIIPFNGIIDQTVKTLEDLFGTTVEILRHQSTFSYEDAEDKEEDYRDAAKNATENWDAPFIVTTAVQFFETIYANKRGKLRKMHNMADSILVFDEVHTMPSKYLQPCLQAIAYITKYLNSEALFLTATMPDYERLIKQYALPDSNICNLIKDKSLFSQFQKCKYKYLGAMSLESVMFIAQRSPSALIIVNRKETARQLYREASGKKYHLSTYMTAYDRNRVIESIKEELVALENEFPSPDFVPENRRITVISTSLIEAGVDLDFHMVCREISGLDSILQAGGRCNREGKRDDAEVIIFENEEMISQASEDERANLTKGLLEKYPDISCPECIKEYYDRLYFMRETEIQKYTMHQYCKDRSCLDINSIPFKQYAEEFAMIDSRTVSVVVEQDDNSKKWLDEIRQMGKGNARQLQKYACSISWKEFEDLLKQHVLADYGTGIWCLTNLDYYDRDIGILFEAKDYII